MILLQVDSGKNINYIIKVKEVTQLLRWYLKNFRRGSSWERYARNAPIQGTAAQILKKALTSLFNWIVDNNYFNKIKIVALVHDEICCEYPEGITNFPQILVTIMTNASKMFMENFPIPAEANVGDYWIH